MKRDGSIVWRSHDDFGGARLSKRLGERCVRRNTADWVRGEAVEAAPLRLRRPLLWRSPTMRTRRYQRGSAVRSGKQCGRWYDAAVCCERSGAFGGVREGAFCEVRQVKTGAPVRR
eukprot:5829948-Pleurochrysis_carterae.AAC.1